MWRGNHRKLSGTPAGSPYIERGDSIGATAERSARASKPRKGAQRLKPWTRVPLDAHLAGMAAHTEEAEDPQDAKMQRRETSRSPEPQGLHALTHPYKGGLQGGAY